MGLETRRVSETRKPIEEIKKEFSLKDVKDMKRLIDSLPTDYIDQQWVKENESSEFSFSTSSQRNDNNQMVQNAFAQMDGIGAFGKNARSSGMSTKELHELNENKPQTIVPQPEETISQTENISPQPVEISNEVEKKIPSTSELPVQPPIIDPVSPTRKESQQQEPVVVDTTALIEELNSRIDKKYNRLLSELSNLYNRFTIANLNEFC